MLQKCEEDLAEIHNHVLVARYTSTWDFEKKNANWIRNYNFHSGELVLVLNKKIEPDIGWKCKSRYFRPMVVVKHLQSSAYVRGPLTHDHGAPPIVSQHNFIVQPLVTKE